MTLYGVLAGHGGGRASAPTAKAGGFRAIHFAKVLPALFVLLGSAPQDKDAEAIYRAMKERIQNAKTLRFEYTLTTDQNGFRETFDVSVKAKGKDRWTMEFKASAGPRRRALESRPISLLSDGRKIVVQSGHEGYPLGAMKPEEVASEIRSDLVTSFLPQVYYLETLSTELHEPEVSALSLVGKEKLGERESQVLQYTLSYPGGVNDPLSGKVWVDALEKRPIKREFTSPGQVLTETITALAIDEEIPDATFSFQSKNRLAQALAAQLADSVRLFGQFTGRHPKSLADLVSRPSFLETDVFWPEGGFILGGVLPRDPSGRAFELWTEKEGLSVVSVGPDGKPGARAPVPRVTRRAIGAPTERLARHYTARLKLHLLASAVRGFREAYGELPKRPSALWEKPQGAEFWPEGGWIPEGALPKDPWGEPYRLWGDGVSFRVEVNDPKGRSLPTKALSREERRALQAIAEPRLTEAEKREVARLLDEAGDDDLETREKALEGLQIWGPAAAPMLEARARSEKDEEARGRLQAARREIPSAPAPYLVELAALSITVGAFQGGLTGPAANERNASASLRTLATAEADFRANDRDGNQVNDYWVGDVAGLYSFMAGGQSIKLIEVSIALADAAPLEKGAAGGQIPALSEIGAPAPKSGYFYQAMTHDASGGKPEPYAQDTDGKTGKVHNSSHFGFCAYPSEYGASGGRTFLINEGNTIFWKDTGGEPVLEWPSESELVAEWQKLE